MKIVFWSPYYGLGSATSSLTAIASYVSLTARQDCCLISTNYKERIQSYFIAKSNVENLMDSATSFGTDALWRDAKSSMLSNDSVQNAAIELTSRLSVFISSVVDNPKLITKTWIDCCEDVLTALDKKYGFVFIDTAAGNSLLNQQVLSLADLIVVCLNQSILKCDDVFNGSRFKFEGHNCAFLIGDYDPDMVFSLKVLRSKYKAVNSKNSMAIRHCTDFANAVNKGNVLKWIASIQSNSRNSANYFAKDVEEASAKLLKLLNISLK